MTRRWAPAWILLLLVAWCAYAPGLSGGYLFDDFINLPALGQTGPVDDWATFWRYLTSGSADPLGRPLSLLTFLVDATDWPASPAPFLRTNLVLHLLNGTLLFVLLRMLSRARTATTAQADGAALLAAGLWLLHPLFVSTTLYIVQREAMLPATFTLLGLIGWVQGRARLRDDPRAGMAWMAGAMIACTALATLSKANGALLPLLALVVETTVLRDERAPPQAAWLRRVLLVVPSVVVALYLLAPLAHLDDVVWGRTWTLAQRLWTEPRVLVEYVWLLFAPRVLSRGVYNDAYVVSQGPLDPVTSLVCAIFVLGAVAAAWWGRKRAPVASAAVLFFAAGHVLESTTIPLELFFEHRNYVPAMLAFWPLALVLARWQGKPAARMAAGAVLLALCGALTYQRAQLWGDQDRMALLWAAANPASARAQATAAGAEVRAGHADRAVARLFPLWRKDPHDLQIVLNYANAACTQGGLAPPDVDGVAEALRHSTGGDQLVHRWLDRALAQAVAGNCRGLDVATVARWVDAASANPRLRDIPTRVQDLRSLEGRLALLRGDNAAARAHFDAALAVVPKPEVAAMQAGLLATAHDYAGAIAHLDRFKTLQVAPPSGVSMRRVHAWVMDRQQYWPRELALLRRRLEAARDGRPLPEAP
jgi:hypothetical protein